MTPRSRNARAAEAALRDHALSYPGAYEEFPWGERVVKVHKKVFVFLGHSDSKALGLSVKLPRSGTFALGLSFASPTGYGLGKAGWISASFARSDDVPLPMLLEWIDESYRAIAPRKLVAQLDGAPAAKKAAARKTAAKKTTAPGR